MSDDRHWIRGRVKEGVTSDRLRLELRRSIGSALALVIATALGLLALGWVLAKLEMQWPWEDHVELTIAVDDASGVTPGKQSVRVAGINAGKIVGSEIVDGRVQLKLKVDGEYGPVYRDARVRVRPATPLQDMYVDIEQRGHPSAGELGDDVLPASRTQTQVEASDVLDVFNADTRDRMGTLINELGRGLGDNGAQLRQAFADLTPFLAALERLTDETGRRRGITRRLIANLGALTEELGRRDRQLTTLVRDGSRAVASTAATERELSALITELPPTLTQLKGSFATLRGALDEVDPALGALRPTAAALAPGVRSLRRFARQARPALAALDRPITALRPLARSLTPTARSLQRAIGTLAPQVPVIDRTVTKAMWCRYAIDRFMQWTPSIFKFFDARGVIPRGDGSAGTEAIPGGPASPNLVYAKSCVDRDPFASEETRP